MNTSLWDTGKFFVHYFLQLVVANSVQDGYVWLSWLRPSPGYVQTGLGTYPLHIVPLYAREFCPFITIPYCLVFFRWDCEAVRTWHWCTAWMVGMLQKCSWSKQEFSDCNHVSLLYLQPTSKLILHSSSRRARTPPVCPTRLSEVSSMLPRTSIES